MLMLLASLSVIACAAELQPLPKPRVLAAMHELCVENPDAAPELMPDRFLDCIDLDLYVHLKLTHHSAGADALLKSREQLMAEFRK